MKLSNEEKRKEIQKRLYGAYNSDRYQDEKNILVILSKSRGAFDFNLMGNFKPWISSILSEHKTSNVCFCFN